MSLGDDDFNLPDVSLTDADIPSIANQDLLQAETNTRSSFSPQKNVKACLKKINFHKEKLKKYHDYVKNKEEMTNLIENKGYKFDELGKIINNADADSDEEDVEIDENQEELLNKLVNGNDPMIPMGPKLDTLFRVDECKFRFYYYPEESCTDKYRDEICKTFNLGCDVLSEFVTIQTGYSQFLRYFNQIPNENLRACVLDCLLLNAATFEKDMKAEFAFNILSDILNSDDFNKSQNKWYISGFLVLEVFKELGLDLEKFQQYFPDILEVFGKDNQDECDKLDKLRYEENTRSMNTSILAKRLSKFIRVFILSLNKRSKFYKEAEIDFLILFFSYMAFDEYYVEDFNFIADTQRIFLLIIELYQHDKSAFDHKIHQLSSCLFEIIKNDQSSSKSNTYHKMAHLLEYFKMNKSRRMRELSFKLAFMCAKSILNDDIDSIPFEELNIDQLISQADDKCTTLFLESSYSMYNLVEFITLIIDHIASSNLDKEKKIKHIDEFKQVISKTNRQVRDQVEYQGRGQVKVAISNFLYRCDFYLNTIKPQQLNRLGFLNSANNEDITEPGFSGPSGTFVDDLLNVRDDDKNTSLLELI